MNVSHLTSRGYTLVDGFLGSAAAAALLVGARELDARGLLLHKTAASGAAALAAPQHSLAMQMRQDRALRLDAVGISLLCRYGAGDQAPCQLLHARLNEMIAQIQRPRRELVEEAVDERALEDGHHLHAREPQALCRHGGASATYQGAGAWQGGGVRWLARRPIECRSPARSRPDLPVVLDLSNRSSGSAGAHTGRRRCGLGWGATAYPPRRVPSRGSSRAGTRCASAAGRTECAELQARGAGHLRHDRLDQRAARQYNAVVRRIYIVNASEWNTGRQASGC